jgi:hypothetical protein
MSVPTSGPPRIAVWLLNLCAGSDAADAIVGDLLEEYFLEAARCSPASATAWFWRQTLKVIPHLLATGFREAPWSTACALLAGLLLMRLAFPLPGALIVAILSRYRVCDSHFSFCMFWIHDGMLMGTIILDGIVGVILGFASKRREMTVTATLASFHILWNIGGVLLAMIAIPRYWPTWTVLHAVALSIAVLSGGALVRICRLRAA